MAQSPETGNPTVTADNPITALLAAPLSPDWTVEGLAEKLLGAIAARRSDETQEFVLDAETITDRQTRRILRPLLACLATKSAAEAGAPVNLYGGRLSFQRPGPDGLVSIIGQFENSSGVVRVAFRRSLSPSQNSEPRRTIVRYRIEGSGAMRYIVEDPSGPFATWEAARAELLRLLARAARRAAERVEVLTASQSFQDYQQAERQLDSGDRQGTP